MERVGTNWSFDPLRDPNWNPTREDYESFRDAAEEAIREVQKQVDCGGTNCGNCVQCLKVHEGFALMGIKEARKRIDRLERLLDARNEALDYWRTKATILGDQLKKQ